MLAARNLRTELIYTHVMNCLKRVVDVRRGSLDRRQRRRNAAPNMGHEREERAGKLIPATVSLDPWRLRAYE